VSPALESDMLSDKSEDCLWFWECNNPLLLFHESIVAAERAPVLKQLDLEKQVRLAFSQTIKSVDRMLSLISKVSDS